jgi:nucleotide-binding universal stress UspA family protein
MRTATAEPEAPTAPKLSVPIKRILAPISLREAIWGGVDYAVGIARAFDAELVLLLVHEIEHEADYSVNFQDYAAFDEKTRSAEAHLTERCTEIQRRHARTQALFRSGVPSEEILQVAKKLKADLAIGSSHHLRWYNHFILPTTEKSPCPIMIVPT